MARYLLGLLLLGVAVVPLVLGGRAWRRRLLPIGDHATGVLADLVISVSALVVLAEVLGTIQLFRLVPVTVVCAACGLGAWWLERTRPARSGSSTDGIGRSRFLDDGWPDARLLSGTPVVACAIAATAALAAAWMARTVQAFNHGMTTTDTLWYHMPFAARFADTGSTTGIHYVDPNPVVPFYPASSELVHALGIVFMGNDLLSPLLNLGWMAVAILAAWCAGRRFGVGWVSVLGVAVLLDTPGLVATQPGGAYTDVVGLAFLVTSVAFLIAADGVEPQLRKYAVAVAALAAGLALGTKFTLVAPVGLLTIGVIAVARRKFRLEQAILWSVLVALTGGYWYVRNLIALGNPLPSLSGIGPLHLPSPHNAQPSSTVLHFLFKPGVWSTYYLPGLRSSLGWAWWAILLAAAIGTFGVIAFGRTSTHRMLGLVALGCGLAFLVTPQFIGTPLQPIYFVYNVRYSAPGILLGLVLLPLVPAFATRTRMTILAVVELAIIAVDQLDSTIWPIHIISNSFSSPASADESLLGAALAVGLVLGVVLIVVLIPSSGERRRAVPLGLGLLVAVGIALAGYSLQQYYLTNRYINAPPPPSPKITAWTQKNLHNARIAIIGIFSAAQYPYYGRNSDNFVQYLARIGSTDNEYSYSTCQGWRRALYGGRFDYLISSSAPEDQWTSSDPSDHVKLAEDVGGLPILLYQLAPRLDLRSCPGSVQGVP